MAPSRLAHTLDSEVGGIPTGRGEIKSFVDLSVGARAKNVEELQASVIYELAREVFWLQVFLECGNRHSV